MKKIINIFMSLALLAGLGSCSKEAPFPGEESVRYGKFSTGSLRVELANENGPKAVNGRTRAAAPSVDDFTVDFIKDNADTVATYRYADMPEIVELPVGSYTVSASYGANASAAWEEPFYQGKGTFEIEADKISEVDEKVVCKFSNVRVSVAFDPALTAKMSDDSKVTVRVGESGSLEFTKADENRSGYFRFDEGSHTLAAHFTGKVEGYDSSETKTYDKVEPGLHYKVTFRLHEAGDDEPGSIGGTDIVVVDASVERDDMNVEIDPGEEDGIVDDMRPTEDPDEPVNPGPGPGTDPEEPTKHAPEVSVEAPYVMNADNDYKEGEPWKMSITSSAEGGIQELMVDIISATLEPALADMNLPSHLILHEQQEYTETLSGEEGLGFPSPSEVVGAQHLTFDLSQFPELIAVLGSGKTSFRFTVKDANGVANSTFTLVIK